MEKNPKLEIVREPASSTPREVLHTSGIRSHGPTTGRSVTLPWPRQGVWRNRMRQIGKDRGRRSSGKADNR